VTTQQDNAPEGFRTVGTVAGVPPVRWLVHEQCGIPLMGGCAEEHREWCERVTAAAGAADSLGARSIAAYVANSKADPDA
jgi:beta-phosphoglucomutase-like phosphatase (HAD superfamily)